MWIQRSSHLIVPRCCTLPRSKAPRRGHQSEDSECGLSSSVTTVKCTQPQWMGICDDQMDVSMFMGEM